MSVCDRLEDQCLTVAAFAETVTVFIQKKHNITARARFRLDPGMQLRWKVYLFPYRYDEVVAGRSIREWVHELKVSGP